MRKIAATVAVVCGLGLMVLPFALSLFDRAPAGQRVTDRFRQTMSTQGLAELKGNFATMGALVDEFIHTTSPALARELHMSDAEFAAYVKSNFPALASGIGAIPPLVAFVTPVAARLERLHPQFAGVDSLPFLGLSMNTIPWILLALGAAMIAVGVLLARTRRRAALWVAATLGAAMIVLPLALSYPAKATDAKQVAAVGKLALSRKAAEGAHAANGLIAALVTEAETRVVPALALRMHLQPAALEAGLAQRYPNVVRGLLAWRRIEPGAVQLSSRQAASVRDASKLNGLDFTPLPWYIIGPGIALLLCAAAALALGEPASEVTGARAGAAA